MVPNSSSSSENGLELSFFVEMSSLGSFFPQSSRKPCSASSSLTQKTCFLYVRLPYGIGKAGDNLGPQEQLFSGRGWRYVILHPAELGAQL